MCEPRLVCVSHLPDFLKGSSRNLARPFWPKSVNDLITGLTLNAAKDVEVRDNYVKTENSNDYSYGMYGNTGDTLNEATGKRLNLVKAISFLDPS